jgi:hypothetical protein
VLVNESNVQIIWDQLFNKFAERSMSIALLNVPQVPKNILLLYCANCGLRLQEALEFISIKTCELATFNDLTQNEKV